MACTLCAIVNGDQKVKIAHQDPYSLTYEEPVPKAPFHYIVLPKKHMESMRDWRVEDAPLLGRVMLEIARVTRDAKIDQTGCRVVLNEGAKSHTSHHVHFHVLGGRTFAWPPG